MSSGFDEEETIGNVRTDCLYKHDFRNGAGSFFNLVTDDEGTTTIEYDPRNPIRNRVKFSAVFIRASGEIQSVTIKKFRQYVTKGTSRWEEQRWGPEDPLKLSHLTFEKLISFINLLTENNLVNLNQRRLALRDAPGATIDPETRSKVQKLLQQPGGPSIVDELLRNGSITSRDLVNLGYRKAQLAIFEHMLSDPEEGVLKYQFDNDIPEGQVEKAWQHFFAQNEWIFGYGLDYRFLGVLQREAHVGSEDLAGRDGSISDFLMSAGKFTVIVELKRPDTPLFDRSRNRSGSWKLSAPLIDAVSQILEQKAAWQIRAETNRAGNFTSDGDLIEQATADPRAILIVGSDSDFSGTDKEQAIKRRTFELFRRDSRNIEILTYDELFERARFVVGHAEQAGSPGLASAPSGARRG